MPCDKPFIPQYLHRNERPFLNDFQGDERFYRIGNPIEFPRGTYTDFSCKWSRLINEADILLADDPPLGDDYRFALIGDIWNYSCIEEKIDGDYKGWHYLTCLLKHKPEECDYSHSVVLIRHTIYNNPQKELELHSWVCTHEGWQKEEYVIQKDRSFYKRILKTYRSNIIAIFHHR
jgi:hypothetical protein